MTDKMLEMISEAFSLSENDTAEYSELKLNGMHFRIRSYYAAGLGHVSAMQAKGFLGLMKMDTLIINPLETDMPLLSYDRVKAFGNDTLIFELYDTLISRKAFDLINDVKKSYKDLPDHDLGSHWYDSIKLSESISKKKKKAGTQFDSLSEEYMRAYLKEASLRDKCDPENKRAGAEKYVCGLLENGGPSTDIFIKGLGKEKTSFLFRNILFGTNL